MSDVKSVPGGYHTVTPHMVVRDVKKAMAFYQSAFGAEPGEIHYTPDGKTVIHAQIQIGDSRVMLAEESPHWGNLSPLTLGNTPISLHIYAKDCDATFNQAVAAGATVKMPPADMFWGDRYAQVTDPFGHRWSIATHLKDMTPEEMAKGAQEAFAKMAEKCG
jgi:PhnB protein